MVNRKFKRKKPVNIRRKKHISRREILGWTLGITAGAGILGGGSLIIHSLFQPATTERKVNWLSSEDEEKRLHENYNKNPYLFYGVDPGIIIPGTRDSYTPTKKDIDKAIEVTISETHKTPGAENIYRNKISQIEIVDSFKVQFGVPEKNSKRAERLISHAEKSIEHLMRFIGSDKIQLPKINFQVPQSIQEIQLNNPGDIVMYLLDRYGEKTLAWYNLTQEGKKYPVFVPISQESYGESNFSLRVLALEEGFKVEFPTYKSIFYRTSVEDKVGLLETPAIEVLHRLLRPYTVQHIDKDIRTTERTTKGLYSIIDKWTEREEDIVHGTSIVWWPYANKDLNLKIPEQELKRRFGEYNQPDKFPKYRGVAKTAEKLKVIGVKQGIEFYMDNPGELFDR